MMRIEILYFAGIRELVKHDRESIDLPEMIAIAQLREVLIQRHRALEGRLVGVRFAIDERFVNDDASLHEGARVALIPPVSGG